jgi:hypothetical protein
VDLERRHVGGRFPSALSILKENNMENIKRFQFHIIKDMKEHQKMTARALIFVGFIALGNVIIHYFPILKNDGYMIGVVWTVGLTGIMIGTLDEKDIKDK